MNNELENGEQKWEEGKREEQRENRTKQKGNII
jgi:hypothetical protein